METPDRFIAECHEDWWSTGIVGLFGSVRPTELDPVCHEQDRSGVLPNRYKPTRLSTRVQEANAVAVPGKPSDPGADDVLIERRIQINESEPIALQAMRRPVGSGAWPGTRIRGAWIEIERPESIDDPLRRDVVL
jgi:hypothetical protein